MNVSYFCPCIEKKKKQSGVPSLKYNLHGIGQLQFCKECQQVKCWRCVELDPVVKFCPQCMEQGQEPHCRKCFMCPECGWNLVIKGTVSADKRVYKFSCRMCDWSYSTEPVENNIPFTKVLQRHTRFDDLAENLNNEFITYEDEIEEVLPVPMLLRCKQENKCKACRKVVVKPDVEPSSIKFYKTSFALDYIPEIRVYRGDGVEMEIINPLSDSITVTIASPSQDINLYTSDIVLGPKPHPSKEIEGIPTRCLTNDTKASRVELIRRMGTKTLQKHNAEGTGKVSDKGPNWCTIPIKVPATISDFAMLVGIQSESVNVTFWCVVSLA